MSVINKMLQDLDRRHAIGTVSGAFSARQVRAVASTPGHEWFWRVVALLTLLALAWAGWVAYQLRPPRALVTPRAEQAAANVRPGPLSASSAVPTPTPSPIPLPPAPPELFRLAESLETPIVEAPATPDKTAEPVVHREIKPLARLSTPTVDKRERPRSAGQEAEARFRAGVNRLNQGRASEAAQDFAAALASDPSHEPARQALVAMHLERREIDAAQRLLEDGLAMRPAQPQFATVLARILVERGDYPAAAAVLSRTRDSGVNDAEYQLLLGTILQRLGRHSEAVDAFQNAGRLARQPSATWVALAFSQEALGRKAEALRAYQQSLDTDPVTPDLRSYAESRIRALK